MSVRQPIAGNISKDALEEAAAIDGSKRSPNMPPRDASTLIILDGEGPNAKVLMGRRHEGHKFMPGLFVFPGGRVDRHDGSVEASSELEDVTRDKIVDNLRNRPTARRARALGLACIRETWEEAGIMLGEQGSFTAKHEDWQDFQAKGITPSLSPLRLIARAITPPGRTRRFDAWFFATRAEHIAFEAPEGRGPSGELQDLHWLSLNEAKKLELPVITLTVLDELQKRLTSDPALTPSQDLPFFHLKGKTFLRDLI